MRKFRALSSHVFVVGLQYLNIQGFILTCICGRVTIYEKIQGFILTCICGRVTIYVKIQGCILMCICGRALS